MTEKRWSPPRVAAAIVLAGWAGLFWFLLLADRTTLYLSSRTSWVVPVGGIILTAAAIGRFASARTTSTEVLSGRRAFEFVVIAAPVVAVLALPPAALGSYAASRRSSFVGGGFVASVEDVVSGELSLSDVAGATRSPEAMRALVDRAGTEVTFIGFVARDASDPADEFKLTRFLVSCCVADALTVQVRVVGAPPGEFKEDDWVEVTGALYPLGREVVVDATEVRGVERPKQPYLNP
jgi:uncharacterized repeat protein (TIGR03943 family)